MSDAHKPASPMTISAKEAAQLESRRYSADQICAFPASQPGNAEARDQSAPGTLTLKANLDPFQAQIAEARDLLAQAPESVRGNFIDAIMESVSGLRLETEDSAPDPTGRAGRVILFRVIGGARFDSLIAALRAKQFDLT